MWHLVAVFGFSFPYQMEMTCDVKFKFSLIIFPIISVKWSVLVLFRGKAISMFLTQVPRPSLAGF
jgi:hypothetical protein